MRTLHISIHNGNLDPEILEYQKKVFDKFGIPLQQYETDLQHGEAMDFIMSSHYNNVDRIYFWDADCIPLQKELPDSAFPLFGCAQQANHIPGTPVYVGPFFLRIDLKVWKEIGQPSFIPDAFHDVAGAVTDRFTRMTSPGWEALYPKECEVEKWDLQDGKFGLGTTYHGGIYHGFESRMGNAKMFIDKCKSVLNG